MEDPTLAYEDMLFFERRLTEVISGMQPKARRWRVVLLTAFVIITYSAYFWIIDPSIRFITLWESLMKHPLFTISLVLLMFLFLLCGVHKRVVASKIVADRCRTVLSDFCLSCDESGKLIVRPAYSSSSSSSSPAMSSTGLASVDTGMDPTDLLIKLLHFNVTRSPETGIVAPPFAQHYVNNDLAVVEQLSEESTSSGGLSPLLIASSQESGLFGGIDNANNSEVVSNLLATLSSPLVEKPDTVILPVIAHAPTQNDTELFTGVLNSSLELFNSTASSLLDDLTAATTLNSSSSESSPLLTTTIDPQIWDLFGGGGANVAGAAAIYINNTLFVHPLAAEQGNISSSFLNLSQSDVVNTSSEMIVVDGKGIEILDLENILKMVLIWFSIGFMIIGGAIPYVFQYIEIYKRKAAVGFSLFVPLTLLAANVLRILFWFGKRFEIPLLVQSVVMILAMLLMLEISVRMNRRTVPPLQRTSAWKGDFFSAFWKWNDLSSFILTLLLFAFAGSVVSVILMKYQFYIEALGMISLLVEACLGLPQLLRNFSRKSTQGMSVKMVFAWLIGDVGKTLYFVIRKAPAQFYICSCLQITIDILILCQVYFYGRSSHSSSRSVRTPSFTPNLTAKI